MFTHGVRPLGGGGVRVRLSGRERAVLRTLPEQLRDLLAHRPVTGPQAAVHARLFPRAYDDARAEEEYRELVGDDLAEERLQAIEVFARTIAADQPGRRAWTVDLDADEAAAWLSVVNDARLCLAVLLGVDEQGRWDEGPDHADPSSVLLYYLGWLEEELVAAVAAGLDGRPGG